MSNTELFGTDGIRARAGEFPLNAEAIVAIGQAVGEKLGGEILIGRDTRLSSPWIFDLMKEGIAKTTAVVRDAGVIPTPAIALLTKEGHFAGGVMISASHNPYEDNGVKVFSSDGTKVDDADETEIERRVLQLLSPGAELQINEPPPQIVTAANPSDWPARYRDALLSHFPRGEWLQGQRIVVDCAHGAMSEIAPQLLKALGAEIFVLNASPTGSNINANCGAVHIDALRQGMKTFRADFGVAFDGDGDRSLFASGSGRPLDGDAVLLLMARRLKRKGLLNPPVVVGTLMTNYALEKKLAAEGITLKRVAVGDRYIFEEMHRSGSVLGGEPSGHIIFSDFRLSGDGLLTTLKVAQAIAEAQASFDDLTMDWQEAPQLLRGVRVREKVPLDSMPAVQSKLSEVERALSGRGRLVVRYSGTEPLLRVMIESDDGAWNEKLMDELLETIREHLNV